VAHAGGAFAIGPTTYTGGPDGLLSFTRTKLIGPPVLLDRQLTASEQSALVQFFRSRGAGEVFDVILYPFTTWDSATDTYTGGEAFDFTFSTWDSLTDTYTGSEI
jgi:hypothetical protein